MSSKIKVGNVYLEIPETTITAITSAPEARPITVEKSDIPEPLEAPQYIFRPNDPFQSGIDEARAISSISTSHKPWVKKTWFILFVLGPLLVIELMAINIALDPRADTVRAFLIANAGMFPFWLCYYLIWRKRMHSSSKER